MDNSSLTEIDNSILNIFKTQLANSNLSSIIEDNTIMETNINNSNILDEEEEPRKRKKSGNKCYNYEIYSLEFLKNDLIHMNEDKSFKILVYNEKNFAIYIYIIGASYLKYDKRSLITRGKRMIICIQTT